VYIGPEILVNIRKTSNILALQREIPILTLFLAFDL
jgi:hypothetical protein